MTLEKSSILRHKEVLKYYTMTLLDYMWHIIMKI